MKKHFFIISAIIIIGQTIFAQDSISIRDIKKQKWSLNFIFSRDYNYRYIRNKTEVPPANTYIVGYTTDDQIPKLGWHASTLISFRLSKHLYFQTGLIAHKQGYKTKTVKIHAEFDKFGKITEYINGAYEMKYFFIGFPFFINRELELTKRLYGVLTFGINYCAGGGVLYLDGQAIEEGRTSPYGEAIINSSIGLNYYTKHRVVLSLKPAFSYFLNSFQDPMALDREYNKFHLYSYGLELGLGFGLGKK